MGIADRPLPDLYYKLRSWISGAVLADSPMSVSGAAPMSVSGAAGERSLCCDCRGGVAGAGDAHCCRSCGRFFCRKCAAAAQPDFCRFCYRAIVGPANSALHCSTCRSYEDDEGEELGRHLCSPTSEVSTSDVDSSSVSTGNEFYSFKSSPLDSPGRAGEHSDSSPSLDHEDHLENTSDCSYGSVAAYHSHDGQKAQQAPLDFENNSLLWHPPPPEDEEDDVESGFFGYNDEDDDVGDSSMAFSSASFGSGASPAKEKHNDANKEHLRSAVNGHFKALVSQLLKGEGLNVGSENGAEGWLDIVSSLSWQAATFVKPDTSRGGSMDPGDYLKVKCIPSGSPSDSNLVKGVVCTKNLKHKRMISQHKNPRLLLLGGALEYQRVPDKLASINTVLEQEINHLKMAVSKIEARRPNVLLVEKSVPSYAQEYLLAKEISLVLNVKKTLLERISRCTGAQISPSVDGLSAARLGQCEMFRIEKVSEDIFPENHPSKKSTKTLMFFEGCPRRLGCTVLLKGACREELNKVKHVVQYATFAAYHLSLESSFLVDEGASLPKIPMSPMPTQEKTMRANTCNSTWGNTHQTNEDNHLKVESCGNHGIRCSSSCSEISSVEESTTARLEQAKFKPLCEHNKSGDVFGPHPAYNRNGAHNVRPIPDFFFCGTEDTSSGSQCRDMGAPSQTGASVLEGEERKCSLALSAADDRNTMGTHDQNSGSPKYFSTADNHQSILVSLSSSCVLKGTVCERSQLFRIKFYGSFDKPLGRYLRDDLFDQSSYCRSCKEPAEAHVRCYTHQQGNLTINVRRLPSVKLPGEHDGRIWMWHRCLKCEHKDGAPPAAHRVVMSDAAWGLSFGKFLELSFSNHTTANRIASCGHSLQRDCLRFYGFGNMVAFFRYSPVNIFSIRLPPLVLDFVANVQEEWVKREAGVISNKMEFLHEEVSNVLHGIEKRITTSEYEPLRSSIHKHIWDLKDLLKSEKVEYEVLLQTAKPEKAQPPQDAADILELNRLRRCLLIDSYTWDRRLNLLDSVSKTKCSTPVVDPVLPESEEWRDEQFCRDGVLGKLRAEMTDASTLSRISTNLLLSKQHEETGLQVLECNSNNLVEMDLSIESVEGYVGSAGLNLVSGQHYRWDRNQIGGEECNDTPSSESSASPDTNLSDKIDLAWTGSGQTLTSQSIGNVEADSVGSLSLMDNPSYKKLMSPVRVYSFDSALRFPNRRLSLSSQFSSIKSFNGPVDYVKDPIQNLRHSHNQRSLRETRSLNFHPSQMPMFITSTHTVSEGARLLRPQPGFDNIVIAVYENDPTSIISYAISSQEHGNFVYEGSWENIKVSNVANQLGHYKGVSNLAPRESISKSRDDHYSHFFGTEVPQQFNTSFPIDPKESHFRISFEDGPTFPKDKVKFSVTCYFAKQFDALRKKCCPDEVDFIRSLSRCKRWNAQGGKSNVNFAKSLDGRFITKQVTKTELDSFEEFAPEYFKYLMESINSGSPTCLAKVLGIYQVTIKYLKTGREVKMDLMVMENLFYRRNISRVYDLKGSSRARYNPDTSEDKVLLDQNLLETLRTKPIFLGSKAKRSLERAVWNDTSFLASIDVMDYSLLVGVDEERKELVIGIIDFMRQYTWDKHLETWVKAAGILGGPKNASPTVVSPKQYKKRFRKAMSSYFLTVPDQWSS